MLTLFTFGYFGWGNATRELVRSIDTAERKKGFSPPVFFDIRCKRNVRAKGFSGEAFQRLLPKGRYRWFPRLGNINVATKKKGIKIADPYSSRILLEEALKYAGQNRRVIFFCACEFPGDCHRHVVANLLLKEAERIGHRIRVTEWPGGEPIRTRVRVTRTIYRGIRRGIVNVRLSSRSMPRDLVGLPWGSIVDVVSGKESFPIISGPAKFQNGWLLPIWDQGEPNTPAAKLHRASEKWIKSKGIRTIWSSPRPSRHRERLKALSIRQPWAHAITHLGKDVENRSWRRNYTGPLLIHASAYREPNPHRLLCECMANPPSRNELADLPTGAIIGVVDLIDYTKDSESKWAEKGAWHLHLRNARPIKPAKCKGQLGLWIPQSSIIEKLPVWVRKLRPH
jgi:hypothetical protein